MLMRVRALLPIGSALAAGLLFTVAAPPYEWAAAAWLVPAALLVPLRGRSLRVAAASGIVFGFVLGCTMTGWLRSASLAYFGFDARMALAFMLGVSLVYGAVPYGLLTVAYAAVDRRVRRTWMPLAGAWLWTASELLRSHLLTGLPWELLGHTQFEQLRLIQIADLGGVHLVSFVIALTSLSIAEALRAARRGPGHAGARLLPAAMALAATWAYGGACEDRYGADPGLGAHRVAIVQGNVANAYRWKREFFEQTLLTYANLSLPLGAERPELIVWPENAVSFYVEEEPSFVPVLSQVAGMAGSAFLFGGPRQGEDGRAHVSAYLMRPDGRIAGVYDKQRLLPFAEYDPFPGLGSGPIDGPLDFAPGNGPTLLAAGTLRLGTVVCYEVLFPDLIRRRVREGAEVLVNIANDSWLDAGDGTAPRQHFSMVPFAAIAVRRALVRASASGISGFVDPYGRPSGLMARATAGVSLGAVTGRRELTVYARWGEAWVGALGLLLAGIALGSRRRTVPRV